MELRKCESANARLNDIYIFQCQMIPTIIICHNKKQKYVNGVNNVCFNVSFPQVTMTGDYILSIASIMISRLENDDVTIILSQVKLSTYILCLSCPYVYLAICARLQILTDLIQGEFMQLGSKESENERFAHYLTKTYRKTASLIANSLKSVRLAHSIYI